MVDDKVLGRGIACFRNPVSSFTKLKACAMRPCACTYSKSIKEMTGEIVFNVWEAALAS
jgi:hypothetical protein